MKHVRVSLSLRTRGFAQPDAQPLDAGLAALVAGLWSIGALLPGRMLRAPQAVHVMPTAAARDAAQLAQLAQVA